jgi:hypothetical protein
MSWKLEAVNILYQMPLMVRHYLLFIWEIAEIPFMQVSNMAKQKLKIATLVEREVQRSPKYTQTMFRVRYGTRFVSKEYATALFAVEEARDKGYEVKGWAS